jgi:hypothetical protein
VSISNPDSLHLLFTMIVGITLAAQLILEFVGVCLSFEKYLQVFNFIKFHLGILDYL